MVVTSFKEILTFTWSPKTNLATSSSLLINLKIALVSSSIVGKIDSSATLPTGTPTLNTILGAGLTGAITTSMAGLGGVVDLEGTIILPPGAYCAFYTSTASGASGGAFSFTWEECEILS